ncbi:fasciclin domain-containing protein [Henriciella barbarensis]|uniref:Fasciclin domain-containing protein n=1 Tax=Henriciella barbarensis TaxID=86342 RepID=A0A399R1Y6_9PROT|nr:fasciclin domain-containing protein [Henriciella barbarensis]RIJ24514.1 fasciclin domain-containing protein [Henriciella barbarensis]
MKKFFASVAATALLVGGASVAFADNHAEMSDKKNIVETASGNDNFSTLVTAVSEAGLVDALSAEGPFTVFAPTNDAFAALPDGTVETLLMDENIEQLQAILQLHVVSGKIKSKDIAEGTTEVETLGGETIEVVNDGHSITVGGAEVIMADVYTSNGVIHAIDSVILPE